MTAGAGGPPAGPAGAGVPPAEALPPARRAARHVPGLLLAAAGAAAALALGEVVGVPPLLLAVLLGISLAATRALPAATTPGLRLAASRLLRIGVVLLGLRLSLGDVAALGGPSLAVVIAVVAATFVGTRRLGAALGVSPPLALLVATGFAICGASAIAAVQPLADAPEEDVAVAVGLVTLCGTLAVLLWPLLAGPLALGPVAYGRFTGASVHDVAQVVAAGSAGGPVALEAAVVVKLTRVALLAPLVAVLGLSLRGRHRAVDGRRPDARRMAPLPLFLVGFILAVVLRTAGVIPPALLGAVRLTERVLFAAALFAIGTAVTPARLRAAAGRPLVLGLASWALVAVTAYAGVRLVTP